MTTYQFFTCFPIREFVDCYVDMIHLPSIKHLLPQVVYLGGEERRGREGEGRGEGGRGEGGKRRGRKGRHLYHPHYTYPLVTYIVTASIVVLINCLNLDGEFWQEGALQVVNTAIHT